VIATALVALWAAAWAVFGVVVVRRAHRVACAVSPPADLPEGERVLLVRPCAGAEPELGRTLSSTRAAVGPLGHAVRVRFSTESADDAAAPVAAAAAADLRAEGIDARWVVAPTTAPNRKAGQLAAVVDADDAHDLVVVVDSDIDLHGLDLRRLVGPIVAGHMGPVARWCAPVERGTPRTLGDRVSAAVLGGSLHAFALLRGVDPDGLVGKTFAVRSHALRAAGGFAALGDRIGEDAELSARLRRAGGRVEVDAQIVASRAAGRSLRGILDRYTRWCAVVRTQRPRLLASYPLLIAAAPLLVTAAWLVGAPQIAGAVALGRIGIAIAARRLASRPRSVAGVLFDATIADLAVLVAWSRALSARHVGWRERRLRLLPDGRLLSEPTPGPQGEEPLGEPGPS
jgi:ceramide glucosyltransferase